MNNAGDGIQDDRLAIVRYNMWVRWLQKKNPNAAQYSCDDYSDRKPKSEEIEGL